MEPIRTLHLGRSADATPSAAGEPVEFVAGSLADASEATTDLTGIDCVVCEGEPDGALVAAEAVRATRPHVPLVVCTGEADATAAIETSRHSIAEYVARSDLRERGETLAERVVAVVDRQEVSDLQATRRELAVQSNRFRHLFEYIPDALAEVEFVDGDPSVRSVNPAFEETFGFEESEVVGENLNDYVVPPDQRNRAESMDDRALSGEVVTAEVERRTTAGVRTFLFRGVTYDVGDRQHGVAIYTDITDQEERQRRLAVLHTVLRHHLRTEMTLIQGYADELAELVEGRPAALEGIGNRVRAVGELSKKVRELERAIGRDRDPPGPTNVGAIVHRVVDGAREAYPTATIETDAPDRAEAIADGRFELAVRNLLENAVEHSDRCDPAVSVTIDAGTDWVTLRVADDGPGIPDRERELVTGERDITQLEHGSGLGLWTVAWLVQSYGGRLRFAENDPRGTVVVVELPVGN